MNGQQPKHELISCERCGGPIECRANSYARCHCARIALSLNETQFVSEQFEGCLCNACLIALKETYRETLRS